MKRKVLLSLVLIMIILIPINAFALGVNNGSEKKQEIFAAKNKMIAIKENLINEKDILKQIAKKNNMAKSLLKANKTGSNLTTEEKQSILSKVKEIEQLVGSVKIPVSDIKIIWNKAKSNNKIRSYKQLTSNLDDIIKLQQKKLEYLNEINKDFDDLINLLKT